MDSNGKNKPNKGKNWPIMEINVERDVHRHERSDLKEPKEYNTYNMDLLRRGVRFNGQLCSYFDKSLLSMSDNMTTKLG